ncbi:hypothetical protein FACS189441_1800 [Betaproteobacteria bacterium]|nr:hypothetical protein FACS189441_1800 [Betaproteobacteria bacterium]
MSTQQPSNPTRSRFLLRIPAFAALPFVPLTAPDLVSPSLSGQATETATLLWNTALDFSRQQRFTHYEQA